MAEERHNTLLDSSLSTPHRSSSSCVVLLKDISNVHTLTRTPKTLSFSHQQSSPSSVFFTASKQTPTTGASTIRRCAPSSRCRKKVAHRLRAFEIEQSASSRKVQIQKERTLNSLERSLSSWLNFLFRDPSACGCSAEVFGDGHAEESLDSPISIGKGKRDSLPTQKFDIGGAWRNPKRLKNRNSERLGSGSREAEHAEMTNLRVSLKDVCSLDDLNERLGLYMSATNCKEVLIMMTQVSKTIDEGRLKMKSQCPLVSDVALKEKAIKVLMCYNPTWLRIGLHIVFGGDSILPSDALPADNANHLEEDMFLRMIIEKQFFSHALLSKFYAYNKSVEGNYRPGYYEALGSVILKRFLLFVLSLDKAKCQNALPLRFGIDGLDGGSPLLFSKPSSVKSSRQVVLDFLKEAMHGEGDLLAHLAILGYKVSYQQPPLAEYEFIVNDLLEDLRDGVRLCRIVQLLQHDASIFARIAVPSENRKKNLHNCTLVMQYLKQVGVPICDGDGDLIKVEDIVNADRELVLSLLWNIFIHLQFPLLVPKDGLLGELSRLKKLHAVSIDAKCMTHMNLLLEWIQEVCKIYSLPEQSIASLVDGKALVCLADYYLRNVLERNSCLKDDPDNGSSYIPYCNDPLKNLDYVQKVNTLIGRFPEVLKQSDMLEQDLSCIQQSVVVLSTFLSSAFISRRNRDHFDMEKVSSRSPFSSKLKPPGVIHIPDYSADRVIVVSSHYKHIEDGRNLMKSFGPDIQRSEEWAREIITTRLVAFMERRRFLKLKRATTFLQAAVRAWVVAKQYTNKYGFSSPIDLLPFGGERSDIYRMYYKYMIERRNFLRVKRSALVLQKAVRRWATHKSNQEKRSCSQANYPQELVFPVTVIQSCIRGWFQRNRYGLIISELKISPTTESLNFKDQEAAAVKIQLAWRTWKQNKFIRNREAAVIRIQRYWRDWLIRRDVRCRQSAVVKIQKRVRCHICRKMFNHYKDAAVVIQRYARAYIARDRLLVEAVVPNCLISQPCEFSRGELESIVMIQTWWRNISAFKLHERSAVVIQAHVRGWCARRYMKMTKFYVIAIQRQWRNILEWRLRERPAVLIQSHVRQWISSPTAKKAKSAVIIIQSRWRGFIARRNQQLESREQLLDLRIRMQKSAANVDDGMRLMNRLIDAHDTLAKLLNCRKVAGILHTCETLDTATHLSQKCCETLAETGAVRTLLQVFKFSNRSIPFIEVLTRVLSTLRNLARYPHIVEVLIQTDGCIRTLLEELLRHKEEGYFIAAEILRKICELKAGAEAIRRQPAYVKRLHSLVEELGRRAKLEKRRNHHRTGTSYTAEKRLVPAKELLHCILHN